MEARNMENRMLEAARAKLICIRDTRGKDGKGLAGVETATGIHRTTLSRWANQGIVPDTSKAMAVIEYLNREYQMEIEEEPLRRCAPPPLSGEAVFQSDDSSDDRTVTAIIAPVGLGKRIFSTNDYVRAFGAMDQFRRECATCVMIGHPGTGKTTVLREYTKQRENTYYIDCWPYMGTRDLLESIAEAMGFTLKSGTVMGTTKQLIRELTNRPGAMLIYDEAENLRGENVKKLDTLRKLCDNTPTTALLAGTPILEEALTKGNGAKSLAQITRRNRLIRMNGVKEAEAREMLRDYNLDEAAREGLIRIATDTAHGGLGNFVELLNICLSSAGDGMITGRTLEGAKKYKLLY